MAVAAAMFNRLAVHQNRLVGVCGANEKDAIRPGLMIHRRIDHLKFGVVGPRSLLKGDGAHAAQSQNQKVRLPHEN